MDTLRQWQRTYSRELDSDAKQQCVATERLLRKALAGGGEAFTSTTVQPRFAFKKNILSDTVPPPPPPPYLSLSHTVPGAAAPAKAFDALQDSQLFDAEMSEPLLSSDGGRSSSQDRPRANRSSEVEAGPASPKRWTGSGSAQRHKARGTEAAVLYGVTSAKCLLR